MMQDISPSVLLSIFCTAHIRTLTIFKLSDVGSVLMIAQMTQKCKYPAMVTKYTVKFGFFFVVITLF